ncbi:MAG: hypothetical protein HC830_10105 [Bacteroidetes bacterium]|nr:hypothetical protein [Bacteroidota bacterium]
MINEKAYTILLHSLLDNILHYADSPGRFASYLSQEIKSIIGVKVVAVINFDVLTGNTDLMGICPVRKSEFLNNPDLTALSVLKSDIKEINYFDIQNGSREETEILERLSFSDCLIVPLIVGTSLEGQIILFDLFEEKRNRKDNRYPCPTFQFVCPYYPKFQIISEP